MPHLSPSSRRRAKPSSRRAVASVILALIHRHQPQVIERISDAPFVAELPAQAQAFPIELYCLRVAALFEPSRYPDS